MALRVNDLLLGGRRPWRTKRTDDLAVRLVRRIVWGRRQQPNIHPGRLDHDPARRVGGR